MIKLVKKGGAIAPVVLTTNGVTKTDSYKTDYTNGITDFTFDSAIYGHDDVKKELIKLQDYKCCFCESKIGHIAYGDVEHYRPKAGWVQNNEPINKPGYYWLAYDWNNLMLSCQICNQRHKKNYFPLATEATRAHSHNDDINKEDPLFIHPVNDEPETHIEFNREVPKAKNKSNRGAKTIEKLGLDRELLNEQRREKLNQLEMVYNLAKGHPDTNQKEAAKALILNVQKETAEYSSMLRCFFDKNPLDF